jgi:hypothetical protein
MDRLEDVLAYVKVGAHWTITSNRRTSPTKRS